MMQLRGLQPRSGERSDRMAIHLLLNDRDHETRWTSTLRVKREDSPDSGYRSALTNSPELRIERRPPSPELRVERRPRSPELRGEGRPRSYDAADSRGTAPVRRNSTASSHGSSSTCRVEKPRREFRPPYSQEEEDFIWYQRDDLARGWKEIVAAFQAQFPRRKEVSFQSLQCKYYRHIGSEQGPQVRERNKEAPMGSYGILAQSGRRYEWMRLEHRVRIGRACWVLSALG